MEYLKLYEVKLSEHNNIKKAARVVYGMGRSTIGNNEAYFLPRIDIKCYGNEGTNANGVSLKLSEFEWFIDSVRSKVNVASFRGYKTHMLNRLPDNGYTIYSIENDKLFGILLNVEELRILIENENYLKFLLKYRFAKADEIISLTKSIYILVLVRVVHKLMQNQCDECKAENAMSELHTCTRNFIHMNARGKNDIAEELLLDGEIDGKFTATFGSFMDLLGVKGHKRLQAMNVEYPKMKNKDFILSELNNYFSNEYSMTKTMMKIIENCSKPDAINPITANFNN
jgi:hypothetical protein